MCNKPANLHLSEWPPFEGRHAHMRRCACQLAANSLLQRFPELGEAPALRPLTAFLTSSADMVKLQRFMGPAMHSFQPALACSPMGVFYTACPCQEASAALGYIAWHSIACSVLEPWAVLRLHRLVPGPEIA